MAYDGKVMRRATARLNEDKQRRAEEYAARRQKLYRMEPKLQSIEQQLRQTLSKIISDALHHGTDPLPAIRIIQDENLELQRQRAELLLAMGYPMDYLEETPACEKCSDTGYDEKGRVCTCLQQYYNEEQKKELSQLLNLGSQSFDTFSLEWYSTYVGERLGLSSRQQMEQNFEVCSNFARRFGKHKENLLLTGRPGVGKTFLSACIAREVTERGFSVVYDTAASVFRCMEDAQFRRADDGDAAAARFLHCDLLILDDLGTEMLSSFVQSAFYRLVNDRLLSGKSTVINTNLSPDQLGSRYSAAILSRIEGEYTILPCYGEDIRLLKRQHQS